MTQTEAETLAIKIVQTWPKSAPVDVWLEDIIDLDEGAAGTAFVRLRRESEYAPSIAKFRATVASLRTVDASNRRAPCEACRDTGWIEAADRTDPDAWNPKGENVTYSQAKPCVCREGRRAEQSPAWANR